MRFSSGEVLGRAVVVTIRNFVTFFVMALIVSAPVFALGQVLLVEDPGSRDVGVRVEEYGLVVPKVQHGSPAVQTLVVVLELIAQGVLAGALSYGVFQALRGQRPSLGACL